MMLQRNKQVLRLRRPAFTLVELLVVIGIISLMLGLALPGIIGLFTAGADVQGRNVIGSILGAARGRAIESQSYTAVHVQIGIDGKCWAAILEYSGSGKFIPAAGYAPQRMPGDIAFGEITGDFVSAGSYRATMNNDAGLTDFTTFNVVFGPDGSLVGTVNGAVPQIETNVKIFGNDGADEKQQVWEDLDATALNEPGIRAMTIFGYKTLKVVPDRRDWLDKNGQFLCINPHTGKMLPTK